MKILFKKGKNKEDVLHCCRADGTDTWAKIADGMMVHELIHWAVEKELDYHSAFYGLLAKGYDITDFERSSASKPLELKGRHLPAEAIWSEHIVHMFTLEFFEGSELENISTEIDHNIRSSGHKGPVISQSDLDSIRKTMQAILSEWNALPAGHEIHRKFPW